MVTLCGMKLEIAVRTGRCYDILWFQIMCTDLPARIRITVDKFSFDLKDPAQNVVSSNCITLLEPHGDKNQDLYIR